MQRVKYHGYTVLQDGTVLSKQASKPMSQHDNGRGYLVVPMRIEGRTTTKAIHRVLAECFIPNPYRLSDVDHIDGNKRNNDLDNLRWVTHGENIQHSYTLKNRSATGEFNSQSTITDSIAIHICELLNEGWSSIRIHREYYYPYNTVRKIKCGKAWMHISKDYLTFEGSETSRKT